MLFRYQRYRHLQYSEIELLLKTSSSSVIGNAHLGQLGDDALGQAGRACSRVQVRVEPVRHEDEAHRFDLLFAPGEALGDV